MLKPFPRQGRDFDDGRPASDTGHALRRTFVVARQVCLGQHNHRRYARRFGCGDVTLQAAGVEVARQRRHQQRHIDIGGHNLAPDPARRAADKGGRTWAMRVDDRVTGIMEGQSNPIARNREPRFFRFKSEPT